jgi:lysyl-tRNA synthetase class 2
MAPADAPDATGIPPVASCQQPSAICPAWRPSATPETLRARSAITDRVRRFFADRGVLEVDTPVLQGGANLDHGVVPFRIEAADGPRFLPTSPEHPLKRLIAAGSGPVWTLAPAFRVGERGRRHGPEFRMLEWYRPGWDDAAIADETVAALALITGLGGQVERLSWREAFRRHAGCDPDAVAAADGFSRAERLDLLLVERIEPQLGRGCWTVLTDYPAEGAAQARLRPDAAGRMVAARFEVYRDGIELANGYHECSDAAELLARHRAELAGRPEAALDIRFHAMLAEGFPDCAGVAVGFDRAVMLGLGLPDVAATQAFAWERA